jgi:hypothetical protein
VGYLLTVNGGAFYTNNRAKFSWPVGYTATSTTNTCQNCPPSYFGTASTYTLSDQDWLAFSGFHNQALIGKVDLRAYGNAAVWLPDKEESGWSSPGWYINVNWDDDDGDGWNPNEYAVNASYQGDKNDDKVIKPDGSGDDDLWRLDIEVTNHSLPGSVKLTFPQNVGVYETNTKVKTVNGMEVSSRVTSGAQFPVSQLPKTLYVEGRGGSLKRKDVQLKAEYQGVGKADPDEVQVTVFEVKIKGLFGPANPPRSAPQQSDNERKFKDAPAGNNKVGIISWDDGNGNGIKCDFEGSNDCDDWCPGFNNCVELQGTVYPSGVSTNKFGIEFDFERDKYGTLWFKEIGGAQWLIDPDSESAWDDDDPNNDDEDLSPSSHDHIYAIDGPGYGSHGRGTDGQFYVRNFREHVWVKLYGRWYQCSTFFKWHVQLYIIPKPNDPSWLTRTAISQQLLGAGYVITSSPPPPPQ